MSTPESLARTPESLALVRPGGLVETIVRGDVPTSWSPPDGLTAVPVSQLPKGWQRVSLSSKDEWAKFLSGFFTDPVTGIEINNSDSVRSILTSQIALVNTALSVGAISPDTSQTIWDRHGRPYNLTARDLIGLLLRYGMHWQSGYTQHAQ